MKRDGKDTNYFLNGQHKSYFFLFNFSSVCVCFGKNYVSLQAGMKYLFTLISLMATLMAVACSDGKGCRCEAEGLMQVPDEGYVMLEDGHFTVDGEVWFPKMMNYKAGMREVDGRLEVVPADFYTGHSVREHFDTIASWGFDAVRICLNAVEPREDTSAMFAAMRRVVMQADSAGLRVMLLLPPPFKGYWRDYDAGLMRCLSDLPALWAYDLMNEPLYFDPKPKRSKREAVREVCRWRSIVRSNAPHQLFTIGLSEPIEVFRWDPSLLPVDFVEIHTYHPLRVQAEMWWYSHHCGKPWMVGETSLPADGDSVSYSSQVWFMFETYRYAKIHGAIGYGWWGFQDCPNWGNFEARYTGLRDSAGRSKPASELFKHWFCLGVRLDEDYMLPANYYNMLAYNNLAVTGCIVDENGQRLKGAVIRGWNNDWSVGVNTFSDTTGSFRLVSNDVCTHFEVSAPGCSTIKFDHKPKYPQGLPLPEREREYHSIPILGWGYSLSVLPWPGDSRFEASGAVRYDMGTLKLKRLQ